MPDQTHVYANGKMNLSFMTDKFVMKWLKQCPEIETYEEMMYYANIKTYLVKVIIDGQEEELKNFGESELEVLDNMVDMIAVEEVLEIVEEETGRRFEGSGSLENLRKLKKHVTEYLDLENNLKDKGKIH